MYKKIICTQNLVETAALSDINNPEIKLVDPERCQYSRRNVHLNIKANNQVATVSNHLPLLLLLFEPEIKGVGSDACGSY